MESKISGCYTLDWTFVTSCRVRCSIEWKRAATKLELQNKSRAYFTLVSKWCKSWRGSWRKIISSKAINMARFCCCCYVLLLVLKSTRTVAIVNSRSLNLLENCLSVFGKHELLEFFFINTFSIVLNISWACAWNSLLWCSIGFCSNKMYTKCEKLVFLQS